MTLADVRPSRWLVVAVAAALAATTAVGAAPLQTAAPPPPQQSKPGASAAGGAARPAAPNPGAALQFLGSVSAPQAIQASETGHTNAGPPAPDADARLAELTGSSADGDRNVVAGATAQAIERQLSAEPTPSGWFAIGSWALGEARADSRRLLAMAPGSVWQRQLNQAALEAARQPAPGGGGANASCGADAAPAGAGAREVARLLGASASAATPEALYRRVCLSLRLSAVALTNAAAGSPQMAARVEGLRALAAAQADDPVTAERLYREGLALDPHADADSAALHAGLGELARERRDWSTAERELRLAREANPRDGLVAFELGDVLERRGQPGAALPLLDQALSRQPDLLLARWSRARAEAALGHDQAAVSDYLAAAPVDGSGELQYQLARLYRKMGEGAQAAAAQRRSDAQRAAARRPVTRP